MICVAKKSAASSNFHVHRLHLDHHQPVHDRAPA
jgi:hypothetical protein